MAALSDGIRVTNEIASLQSFNWQLKSVVHDLESKVAWSRKLPRNLCNLLGERGSYNFLY